MKIGLVCPYDVFRGGGVQEHVLAIADELRLRGHEVKILTPRPRKYKGDPPHGILFVGNSASVTTPLKTTNELGMSFTRDEVDDMLVTEQFDLLHIHEPELPILGAQLAAKAICPVIATFHAISPDTLMGRTFGNLRIPYARSIFPHLDAMTAVSDAAAKFAREQTGRTVEIIPNCIDLQKYRAPQTVKPTRLKTILYVGRLEKRKGVLYLLKAYSELAEAHKDVELIIAGAGHLRRSLEKFVADNELPRVRFLGFVDEATKLKLLHASSLFCSPALYGESFGIVLLEAMAADLPLVAGDNVGYAGVMQSRGALSLVNPKATTAFARQLELLLYDAELRKLWCSWADEYVEQFAVSRVTDKYEALYKKVVRGSKP